MKKIVTLKVEIEADEMPSLRDIKRDLMRQLHFAENKYTFVEIKTEEVGE